MSSSFFRWSLGAAILVASACSSSGGTGAGGASSSSASASGAVTTASASTTSASASSSSAGGAGPSSGSAVASSSSAVASSSSAGGSGGAGGALPMGTRVRVVAANLTSGNQQSYDPGHGQRILQGVHPDIVLLQEFNYGTNSAADLTTFTTSICGVGAGYTRGAGQIPNGVLSRYPILASGSITDALVSNRDFVWARIDVPGPIDLWAFSVHLLTSNPTVRSNETTALASAITAMVPAGDYVALGGDFNTAVRNEPAVANLDALFAITAPYPADQNGNDMTSAPRTRPYDWVLADDDLTARAIPLVIGASTYPHGAVVDTRVYQPLTEIAPALVGDSGATGMQHMAVVRDFALE